MKIIHSADWHLGIVSWKSDRPIDRFEEQKEVIENFIETVKGIEPDLIILAGDLVHHRRNPPVRSLKLLFESFVKLSKISPVVTITGNHDWEGLNLLNIFKIEDVHVISLDFLRKRSPLSIETNSGVVKIIPVPYVSGSFDLEKGRGKTLDIFRGLINEMTYRALNESFESLVVVGHVMMRGALPPSVEDNISMVFDPSFFPSQVDYVALGHVHKSYKVSEIPLTLYSGSVIQLDFSETEDKGFLLVNTTERKVEFFKLPHRKVGTVDLRNALNSNEMRSAVDEAVEMFDYIRLVVDLMMFDDAVKLKERCERIVKVDVVSKETEKPVVERNTFKFDEMFEDFFRSEFSGKLRGEEIERALEVFRDIYERYEEHQA